MTQKESIIKILEDKECLTQAEIAENIYNDDKHTIHIHTALTELLDEHIITRITEVRPYIYYRTGKAAPMVTVKKKKKELRDVSNDVIDNDTLDAIEKLVMATDNYGEENRLITRCIKRFPLNTDPDIVAMKLSLIDTTNSTNLSRYKDKISVVELSNIIACIPDIDERLQNGDPTLVREIAKSNNKIKLLSFASKYCCYHNRNLYGKDDYSIVDTVLETYLPLYFENDINSKTMVDWHENLEYEKYNDFIKDRLDERNITTENRRRKFDHFVWYKNRKN